MMKNLFKKSPPFSLLKATAIVAVFFSHSLMAQNSENAIKIGESKSFMQKMLNETAISREVKSIQTTESILPLEINVQNKDGIRGGIIGIPASNVFFDFINGTVEGKVILTNEKKAYNYFTDATGNLFVESVDINTVLCVDMYNGPIEPTAEENVAGQSMAIPQLESMPGETAVVLLDFDGHVASGGRWKNGQTINAQASGLNESQITTAFYVISEDYRPYKINITTIESVYLAAPKNRRMRCVITPTNDAAPGAGGVAYISSFTSGDPDNTPCWVFNLGGNGKTTGETCSHEVGHTVGLNHDGISGGASYYQGHSNWAPIMGASYSKAVGQWSKGEYTSANNKEDDVNIIGTKNGFTFRADEAGNTISAAAALKIESDNVTVKADKNYGVISKSDDIDVYSFRSSAGNINFTVKPAPNAPNLDILLKITDASGKEIANANPSTLSADITATLTASGIYYLHIDGTGDGKGGAAGYTDYGSIGEYTIEGKIINIGTGISKNSSINFSLYPNPANDLLNINLNTSGITNTIQIVNMLGQTVDALQTGEQYINLNLSEYNKGLYFITVSNSLGSNTAKFIKE